MRNHYQEDWSQWPYVNRTGHPSVAQHMPWGYPTLSQTDAYRVYGPPPRPKQVNHALHVILMIVTMGFWFPVWLGVMVVVHNQNTRAEADYWFRIQQYWQWELTQQSVNVPRPRELPQGG